MSTDMLRRLTNYRMMMMMMMIIFIINVVCLFVHPYVCDAVHCGVTDRRMDKQYILQQNCVNK